MKTIGQQFDGAMACENRQQAQAWLLKESMRVVSKYPDRFGYVLWFATVTSPDNKDVLHANGEPYAR